MTDKNHNKKGQYVLPPGLMRLHAELAGKFTSEEESILKKYGGVRRGRTISRDLIVRKDMPLICLHMALQRAFGFHGIRGHAFTPGDEAWDNLKRGTFDNYDRLRGVIFADQDCSPAPAGFGYPGGGFNKWLRNAYSRDCYGVLTTHRLSDYHPRAEDLEQCRKDRNFQRESCPFFIDMEKAYYGILKLMHSPNDTFVLPAYVEAEEFEKLNPPMEKWSAAVARPAKGESGRYETCTRDDPESVMLLGNMRLRDTSWDQGSQMTGCISRNIIERLPLKNVLAPSSDYLPFDERGKPVHKVLGIVRHPKITDADLEKALKAGREIRPRPFTAVLRYEYDFQDHWLFTITGSRGCSDLTQSGAVSCEDVRRAAEKCLTSSLPVLLAMDGDMLAGKFGGVQGYLRFLDRIRLAPGMVIREVTGYFDDARWTEDLPEDKRDPETKEIRERQICGECRAAQDPEVQKWLDENNEPDGAEDGLSRADLLLRAIEFGWHRNDFKPEDLL